MDHDHGAHVHSFDGQISAEETVGTYLSFDLTTVGIDIGTATSHFSISRLRMDLQGTRYAPTSASLLYQSPIVFTPFVDGGRINAAALTEFVDSQYRLAQIDVESIDTGVVLLTGLAAEKNNARLVAEIIADASGRFVSISAGDQLEALLSVRGSGALALSREEGINLLHIDIGGGTTKFVYCRNGEVVSTAALAVGARLVAWDESGVISRLEGPGRRVFRELGIVKDIADGIDDATVAEVCEYLVDRIMDVITGKYQDLRTLGLLLTPRLMSNQIDALTISGGVSEYIYARSSAESHRDLGQTLARVLDSRLEQNNINLLELPSSGIRSTVIGASRFAVQVSSQTVLIDPLGSVPIRNVPVIRVAPLREVVSVESIVRDVEIAMAQREITYEDDCVALALAWTGSTTFGRLDVVARGLLAAIAPMLDRQKPLIVLVDQDVGRLLGLHMRYEKLFSGPMVFIDNIEVSSFDFVDIGETSVPHGAIPVVAKTLLFPLSRSETSVDLVVGGVETNS